jgi:hypothetical protein
MFQLMLLTQSSFGNSFLKNSWVMPMAAYASLVIKPDEFGLSAMLRIFRHGIGHPNCALSSTSSRGPFSELESQFMATRFEPS